MYHFVFPTSTFLLKRVECTDCLLSGAKARLHLSIFLAKDHLGNMKNRASIFASTRIFLERPSCKVLVLNKSVLSFFALPSGTSCPAVGRAVAYLSATTIPRNSGRFVPYAGWSKEMEITIAILIRGLCVQKSIWKGEKMTFSNSYSAMFPLLVSFRKENTNLCCWHAFFAWVRN